VAHEIHAACFVERAAWRANDEAGTPTSVFGPVLLIALRRLAAICWYEVMASQLAN
jgi:hypothetical protein